MAGSIFTISSATAVPAEGAELEIGAAEALYGELGVSRAEENLRE